METLEEQLVVIQVEEILVQIKEEQAEAIQIQVELQPMLVQMQI